MNSNIVIATVPWTDTNSPLMAPAVLKSALAQHNLNSVTLDLNQEIRGMIAKKDYQQHVVNFFIAQKVHPQSLEPVKACFEHMVSRIASYEPTWICLSLLTYLSQHATRWLCFLLRQCCPDSKIVIGGPGCFNSLKNVQSFATGLKTAGLIDHYISGDGEISLPALIKGQIDHAGIDSPAWQEIKDLNVLPMPDYSDYLWSLYPARRVGVLGSRGCVRSCTFCDIHEHWEKYQWRSAESIFAEIQHQHKIHGVTMFNFADSLINGNQREYRRLIKLLADYNAGLPMDQRVKWTSFFIFRPERDMPEEDWKLTAQSGAVMLMVGVESFVETIRYHMGKKFSNKDLDHGLELAKKYQVPLSLLLIVGYATETEQDHQQQLQWIRDHSELAGMPVIQLSVGSTLGILPGTDLFRNSRDLGIAFNSEEVYQDWTNHHTGSTPELRLRWHAEIISVAKQAGFNIEINQDNHMLIEQHINKNHGQV